MIIALMMAAIASCLTVPQLSCSKSNSLSSADYTIQVVPNVQVLATAIILIEFPHNYNLTLVPTVNSSFSLVNYSTLSYPIGELLQGISYTLVIPQVINPSVLGSSGLFAVYTYKGPLLIEQNLTARMVGLASTEKTLVNPSIYLDSNSLPTAGEIAYYNFIFTLNVSAPYAVSVWLLIPLEFVAPAQPTCSTFGINQQSNNTALACHSIADKNIIVIDQYSTQPLASGTRFAIKVSLLNPNRTGTTGKFSILVYKSNTSYVVSSYYNVSGVVIQQGNIYSVSFAPFNPYAITAKSKTMDYQLSFTPKNPLSSYNSVEIQLPTGFSVLLNSGYDYVRILQGLAGGSLSWSTSTIVVANTTVLGKVVIVMRLVNPPTAGNTNQLLISTYDKGILVDRNNQLSTTIQEMDADAVRVHTSFQVGFYPLTNYTLAKLVVSNLQVNSPQCLLNSIAISCYSLNGQVFFGNGNLTFTAYQQNTLEITNLNYNPGTYLLDLFIQDASNSQSSTAVVIIPSNSFTSAAVQIIDEDISVPPTFNRSSIANITFVTDYPITGALRLAFGCSSTDCSNFLSKAVVKPIKGLAAIIGQAISIKVVDNQTFQLSNFVDVPLSTYVQVHVAGLSNPLSGGSLSLTVTNQLDTTLSVVVFDSFSTSLAYTNTPSMQYGYSAIEFNLSASNVDNEFVLQFQPMLNDDQHNIHLLIELPGYDTMFLREKNTVGCRIDLVFYECISYPTVDWILIKNIPVLYMTNPDGSKPTVTLYGLQWPTYSDTVGYITWRALDVTTMAETDRKTLGNIIGNTTFTAPKATNLAWGRLALSDTAAAAPGVVMYFNFQTSTLLPNSSVVVLALPAQFSLNTSIPVPQVQAPMFSDSSPTLPMTVSVGTTTVTFTNVAAVPQLSTISITLRGVRMPTIATLPNSTNNFSLTVTKNGKAVTSLSGFDTLHYARAFSVDTVSAELFVDKPVTSLTSQYTFQLQPYHSIPKYGSVVLVFPFNLTFLSCGLVGAISDFTSCTVGTDNKTLTMSLNQNYYTGAFNLTLQDVLNPSSAGDYTIIVKTYYDGILMDTVSKVASLYSVSNSIIASVAASPTSQGEWGLYNLTVTITQPADTIMVSLSRGFSPESQLIAKYGQFQVGTYYIGFGSVNPAVVRTNTISVLSWLQGVAQEKGAVGFVSSVSPGWLQLNSYSVNDSLVGRPTELKLSVVVPFLESQTFTGRLQVEFDVRFDCTYAKLISSNIPLQLSSRSNIVILESATVYSGPLQLTISLLNPNVSDTYSFSIRSQTNQAILSQSFPDMDYLELVISDIGPAFWVNSNQSLLVYENTISGEYILSVAYPSRLSFVVTPIVLTQGIEIVPAVIEMGLYSTNASFRVVAYGAAPGTYQVKWSIGTDSYHSFYNPIQESQLKVLTCPPMNINVQPINLVPVSGTTLPLQISVPFAPTVPLMVTLTPNATDPFVYSSTQLVFVNSTSVWFSINSTLQSSSSSFFQGTVFSLASNHSNYTLSVSYFSVISLPYDTQPPFVSELNLIEQQRDHVVISVGASQLSLVRAIVQHWYDSPPEVVNHLLQPAVSVQPLATLLINLTASVLQNITVHGLSAGTHYTIYCLAVDRAGNDSPLRSLQLQTAAHYQAIEILYPFNQPNITSQERDAILIPQLAFYLSIPTAYLLNPYSSALYTSQLAGQYIQGTFYQPLWIVVNDSYSADAIRSQLPGSLSYIRQFLPHTSSSGSIYSAQVSWRLPNITNVSLSSTIGQLTVNVTLDHIGTVFVSAYQKQLNYSYQIKQQANCTEALVNSLTYSCTISVETSSSYFVHVASGDIGPLFPTLSNQYRILTTTTLPAEQVYHLNINHSSRLGAILLILLALAYN